MKTRKQYEAAVATLRAVGATVKEDDVAGKHCTDAGYPPYRIALVRDTGPSAATLEAKHAAVISAAQQQGLSVSIDWSALGDGSWELRIQVSREMDAAEVAQLLVTPCAWRQVSP